MRVFLLKQLFDVSLWHVQRPGSRRCMTCQQASSALSALRSASAKSLASWQSLLLVIDSVSVLSVCSYECCNHCMRMFAILIRACTASVMCKALYVCAIDVLVPCRCGLLCVSLLRCVHMLFVRYASALLVMPVRRSMPDARCVLLAFSVTLCQYIAYWRCILALACLYCLSLL